MTRREALKTVAGAGLVLIMASRVSAAPDQWAAVGKSEMFVAGKPQQVTLKNGGVLYITRTDAKTLTAASAKCTHRGCEVEWAADAGQFQCPCHGAAFASSGANCQCVRMPVKWKSTSPVSLPMTSRPKATNKPRIRNLRADATQGRGSEVPRPCVALAIDRA